MSEETREIDILAYGRGLAHAMLQFFSENREKYETLQNVVMNVQGGWLYFDGEKMCRAGMMALSPEGCEAFYSGQPVKEEHIWQRVPSPDEKR